MNDNNSLTNSGLMGGNAGDGQVFGTQQPQTPSTPGNYGGYRQGTPNSMAYQTPQQQHQQGGVYPAGSGSITRFASPQSTQAQPGTPLYPQSSPYNFAPPPQPGGSVAGMGGSVINNSGGGMSFAQRSAMLQQQHGSGNSYGQGQMQQQQQQQQQQQPPQQQQAMSGYATQQPQYQQEAPQQQPREAVQPMPQNTAGMSFAQRSQMMQQATQPPQQQSMYGQQPQQQQQTHPQQSMYGSQTMQQPQQQPYLQQPGAQSSMMGAPQQQQPQMQQPQYGGTSASQPGMASQPAPVPSGGSYAERSAMARSSMGAQPQMTQSAVQPQSGGVPTNTPGFPQQQEARAATAKPNPNMLLIDPPEVIAQQNRLLTEATRKVQEHAYYMKQAMDRHDLPMVLDRAAAMVGELGEHAHSHHHHHLHPPAPGATGSTTALSPKNYYELHLRALEELPTLEDYLLGVAQGSSVAPDPAGTPSMSPGGPTNINPLMSPTPTVGSKDSTISYTMKELYDCVQYCPNVLSRLYLQVCAASALIRSGQVGARWVMKDMIESVKCVQNPVRGLFLRHYLLQAFRDKLPNEAIPVDQIGGPISAASMSANTNSNTTSTASPSITANVTSVEQGTVKDSYEFVLANFIEMNKLWVRIQHLPGDGKSKEVRRRREKDRNELRILVGTNLVRLSSLDSITSTIYGQVILPTVLDHIVICGDPLAQAYLIDCIVQVFPDEYHIETMPILLGVCPKLRDKVNIRTILKSLMDRLANYLADEELLDEKDSNQVKQNLAKDSFRMFEECVQHVFEARGPRLQAREAIRLQTALLGFSMKCYQGNLDQVTQCLRTCCMILQQLDANHALFHGQSGQAPAQKPPLEERATKALEEMLSIPLDELALGVLNLDHYADLIRFLPWANRRQVALTMLEAVSKAGSSPSSVKEIEELFSVIAPVLRDEHDSPPGANDVQASTERTTHLMANLGVTASPGYPQQAHRPNFLQGTSFQESHESVNALQCQQDTALVSKLIHLLGHSDTDVLFEMLTVARTHISAGKRERTNDTYQALVFAALKLAKRKLQEEIGEPEKEEEAKQAENSDDNGDQQGADASEPDAEEKSDEADNKDGPEKSKENIVEGKEEDGDDEGASNEEKEPEPSQVVAMEEKATKTVSCRKVFVFIQQTIAALAKGDAETGVKLYLEAALTADKFAAKHPDGKDTYGPIAYELISQSFSLYEEHAGDSRLQKRCIVAMIGALLACRSARKDDFESLVMKTAQYAAKMLKKPDQCEMVAQCSHLFYVVGKKDEVVYSNPQRGLECLQRALKLADACTSANPGNLTLFVDLLEHYLFFFEKKNPLITGGYITGLVALIKEHSENLGQFGGTDVSPVGEAKSHFMEIVRHIKLMKEKPESADRFAEIDVSSINA